MGKTLLTLFSFVIIACSTSSCRNKGNIKLGSEEYFFSTDTESNERVKKLELDRKSEDASYILDIHQLKIPKSDKTKSIADTANKEKAIDELNKGVIVILKSDVPFNGMLVWDVLQSVGLKWGDGDLFHWSNPGANYGDEVFFSVWTTTEPGYFLPEDAKKGKRNPKDLVFGFSIPRSADPENVFSAMIKAAKYCQKRLGGRLLNGTQWTFNENEARKDMESVLKMMKEKGIEPGSEKALRTY